MRPEKKLENEYTAVVIDFKTGKTVHKQADGVQEKGEEKSCFRTNHSYYCHETDCSRWRECQQLVAAWMR